MQVHVLPLSLLPWHDGCWFILSDFLFAYCSEMSDSIQIYDNIRGYSGFHGGERNLWPIAGR